MTNKCDVCGGLGSALPINRFPAVVRSTIQRRKGAVENICNKCVEKIGEEWGFRRDVNSRDCASLNYSCERQKQKTRRVKSLSPIPACSPDGRLVLGIPEYAPINCICRTCYAFLQNEARRDGKRAVHPTAAQKKPKKEPVNHDSREELSMDELKDALVRKVATLPADNRAPILDALLGDFRAKDITRLFNGSNSVRCQLYRMKTSPTTSTPETKYQEKGAH
eukprot:TRINITY_DN574_c1_g1_i1.p1 TRINITY_DN574_c1_g1~~TRINITY_DN574_c1_g1_i1.p1  ORF type:complete len:222 (+),score=10.96 TRINITY_DN574_c1_g1_i1:47-712(+)